MTARPTRSRRDTFIQAYTHLGKFQGRAELETWLTRIVINRSRDWLRRRKFVSIFSHDDADSDDRIYAIEPVDEQPDAERLFMSHQLRAAILRAERTLSSQQKIIFRLRHYEKIIHSVEIAELLSGAPRNASGRTCSVPSTKSPQRTCGVGSRRERGVSDEAL